MMAPAAADLLTLETRRDTAAPVVLHPGRMTQPWARAREAPRFDQSCLLYLRTSARHRHCLSQ